MCFQVTRQVINGFQIRWVIYLTFTLRSYNYSYLLHNLTPRKLKTITFLSCILAPGFFLVLLPPAYFVCPQYLGICLPQSFLALYSPSTHAVLVLVQWSAALWQTYPCWSYTVLPFLAYESLVVLYCTTLPGRRILTPCCTHSVLSRRRILNPHSHCL
jgi:hypothetical protein